MKYGLVTFPRTWTSTWSLLMVASSPQASWCSFQHQSVLWPYVGRYAKHRRERRNTSVLLNAKKQCRNWNNNTNFLVQDKMFLMCGFIWDSWVSISWHQKQHVNCQDIKKNVISVEKFLRHRKEERPTQWCLAAWAINQNQFIWMENTEAVRVIFSCCLNI